MQNEEIKQAVYSQIRKMCDSLENIIITDDTPLIGSGRVVDSMSLVELGLFLEDLAEDIGFIFHWKTSTSILSNKGMFRTAGSLVDEFIRQKDSK